MNLLFVCTGNTCRSPMAEAIWNAMAVPCGLPAAKSAGLYAVSGDPASPHAITAAAEYGGDLSRHRAQPVTEALLSEADRVYCMTPSHLAALSAACPAYREKYVLFTPSGVPDPYGGDLAQYLNTAAAIHTALTALLREVQHG